MTDIIQTSNNQGVAQYERPKADVIIGQITELVELLEYDDIFRDDDSGVFIYKKPVGKNDKGEQQYAEGMSVRAAELLASYYGGLSIKTAIIENSDEHIKSQVTVYDAITGSTQIGEVITSKYYTASARKGGSRRRWSDDMLKLKITADQSKLRRNLILQIINPVVKLKFEKLIREKMKTVLKGDYVDSAETRKQKMLKKMKDLGFSTEDVETIISKKITDQLDDDDYLKLRDAYHAVKDGASIASVCGYESAESETITQIPEYEQTDINY